MGNGWHPPRHIYAAYRGDAYIGEGTVEEIAKMAGVSVATARFGATQAARRRDAARKMQRAKCMLILEPLDMKDDDR